MIMSVWLVLIAGYAFGIATMILIDLYKWVLNPQGYKKWWWKHR